jgi:thioredoxin 1
MKKDITILWVLILVSGCIGQVVEEEARISEGVNVSKTGKTSYADTEQGFKDALTSGKPVLVNFYATWCIECRNQAPIIEELKEEYKGMIILCIDTDRYSALANRYRIFYLPTVILFDKKGEELKRFLGFTKKTELEKAILTYL